LGALRTPIYDIGPASIMGFLFGLAVRFSMLMYKKNILETKLMFFFFMDNSFSTVEV
jgi:hypothetical protein